MTDEFIVRVLLGQWIVQHADIIVAKAASAPEAVAAAVSLAKNASRSLGPSCVVLEKPDYVRTTVWDSTRDGFSKH